MLSKAERAMGRAWMLLAALVPDRTLASLGEAVDGLDLRYADRHRWWHGLRNTPHPTAAQLVATLLGHGHAEDQVRRELRKAEERRRKEEQRLAEERHAAEAEERRRRSARREVFLRRLGIWLGVAAALLSLVSIGLFALPGSSILQALEEEWEDTTAGWFRNWITGADGSWSDIGVNGGSNTQTVGIVAGSLAAIAATASLRIRGFRRGRGVDIGLGWTLTSVISLAGAAGSVILYLPWFAMAALYAVVLMLAIGFFLWLLGTICDAMW